jgi:hypothetical protein
MRNVACFLILSATALAVAHPALADDKSDAKGKEIVLDGLKSRAPGTWVEEAPTNKMRFAQYRLPKAKGDDADAELVIFKGLGGSAKQNIDRWKAQFVAPEGKKIDDVVKVEDIKIAGREATYLDVQGTYLFKARPFDPDAKTEKKPDYRLLAVHFDGPSNVYHIKLTGPAKTVEQYKKGFDEWLHGLKAD